MSLVPHVLVLAADTASRVGSGRIQGGWEYVYAAYGISWAASLTYVVSLWLRHKSQEQTKEP